MNPVPGGVQGATHASLSAALVPRSSPVAARPVARTRPVGAGPADHRNALPASKRGEVVRPMHPAAPHRVPVRVGGHEADRLARPWPPFVAQHLAQRLAPEPDEQNAWAARLAYRAAAERGTVFFGVDAPIDVIV